MGKAAFGRVRALVPARSQKNPESDLSQPAIPNPSANRTPVLLWLTGGGTSTPTIPRSDPLRSRYSRPPLPPHHPYPTGGVPPPLRSGAGGPCPDPIYPPRDTPVFPFLRRKGQGGKRSREGDPPVPTQTGTPLSKKCTTPPGGPKGSAGLGGTPPTLASGQIYPPRERKWVFDVKFRGKTIVSCAEWGGNPLCFARTGGPLPDFLNPFHAGQGGLRFLCGTPHPPSSGPEGVPPLPQHKGTPPCHDQRKGVPLS